MGAEIHALSGAYAIHALSDAERVEFEEHLATCAACRDEVDNLRATAARLAGTVAASPPPSVRDAVLAGIREIRPLPPESEAVSTLRDGSSLASSGQAESTSGGVVVPLRRRWVSGLVAAAAVVAALGAGAVVWHPWDETTQVSAIDQVISAADAQRLSARVQHGTVTLVRSASVGRAVVLSDDLAVPPDDKVYELWLQNAAGDMVPAGLLPRTSSQSFLLSGDAATAKAAGITLEPAGGSDQPTTIPLALFPFGATT